MIDKNKVINKDTKSARGEKLLGSMCDVSISFDTSLCAKIKTYNNHRIKIDNTRKTEVITSAVMDHLDALEKECRKSISAITVSEGRKKSLNQIVAVIAAIKKGVGSNPEKISYGCKIIHDALQNMPDKRR